VNLSLSKNWEFLETRFVGTGGPDTTKFEWGVNLQRDAMASHLGHHDLLSYFSVAENESVERVRMTLIKKMVQPCGPPPRRYADEEDIE
jgi:splicing factor 3B subunit 5